MFIYFITIVLYQIFLRWCYHLCIIKSKWLLFIYYEIKINCRFLTESKHNIIFLFHWNNNTLSNSNIFNIITIINQITSKVHNKYHSTQKKGDYFFSEGEGIFSVISYKWISNINQNTSWKNKIYILNPVFKNNRDNYLEFKNAQRISFWICNNIIFKKIC